MQFRPGIAYFTSRGTAVVDVDHPVEVSQARLHAANQAVWGRSRDHQQSATIADLFIDHGEEHFRALECRAVADALAEHAGVLALGGGAVHGVVP